MVSPSHPRLRRSAALITLAFALAACGGGGGGGSTSGAGGGDTGGSAPTPPAAVGPAITAQPVSQAVVAGQAVTFSVAADSTTLSYQWQRDGKDIPGATGLTYTLADPQAADNGSKFTAIATGARGSTTSSAAVLGVSVPKGLALVAGTPGGPGNLDGTDGEVAMPGVLAVQPSGALYLVEGDGSRFASGLRAIDLATGALTTVERDPALRELGNIAVDPAGNVYDAPWQATAVYRTPPGGKRAVFAGAADQGGSADGAAATARFTGMNGFAMDAAGTLYVNDGGKKIRKVARDGSVVTLAGGGAGDMADGTGAQAAFRQIGAMAAGRDGTLTLIDDGVLRSVSPAGVVTTRKVGTVDGGPFYLASLSMTVDGAGNAYVQDWSYPPKIRRIAPDGSVTTVATLPPSGSSGTHYTNLVADAAGNLYVGDDSSQVIRRVTPAGVVSDFAGRAVNVSNVDATGPAARFSLADTRAYDTHYDLATDAQGNVYVGQIDRIRKVTPAGVVATLPLPLGNLTTSYYPASEAIDGSVLAVSNGVISRIDAAGKSHFIAGQAGVTGVADGVGAKATFSSPKRLIVDGAGNIYLTDTVAGSMTDVDVKTYRRKIAPDGTVTTLPDGVSGQLIANCAPDKDGKFWSIDDQRNVLRIAPDGTKSVVRQAGDLNEFLDQATCDRGGNLYLAMSMQGSLYAVHKITPAGTETVIAGHPGTEGVRAGTPGSLAHIDAITVAPDGTVYVMSQEALVRILQ
jgi:sugar lactone lactonase YvrE